MSAGNGDARWPGGAGDFSSRELAGALAEARGRLPDDVTLRRMWARVAQLEPEAPAAARASRKPRWFWFAGGVVSTAALAVAAVVWLGPGVGPRHAPLAMRAEPAPVVETRIVPAAEGTVRTGEGERLNLRLVGGTEARLESSSVMRIDRSGRPSVDGGEVAFSVPHQPTGHSYVVLAGPYRVVVLGTKFRLRQDGAHRVFVDVQEGVVEVWDHARLARLSPGETWASPDLPEQGPAVPEAQAAPPREPVRAVALSTPAKAPAADVPADEAAARAQAALAAGEVTRALGLYRALAQRGGPAAENAAYEVGKILRDRMGQPASAVAAWRRYRSEHPNGVLRVEADVSIVETLVHAGDTTAALAEANDFVRNHPDSERRAEMARIAGDLYRTRADWRRAAAAYQAALASPQLRGAAHDEIEPAAFHRAECLMRLGDAGGAEATRAYLRSWPNGRFRAEAERLLEMGDDTGAAARL